MKIPIIIIATFIVAFITSFLLDMQIIRSNPVRYWIIVAFILMEFVTGIILVLSAVKEFKGKEN